MPEPKRLVEVVEDYVRYRRARGKAASTTTNEMYVLRGLASWYGDVRCGT
jgi:hypothetical protein